MLIYVPLSQIDDNPFQARHEYGDIAELAGHIAAALDSYPETFGLMQIPRGRVVLHGAVVPVDSLGGQPAAGKTKALPAGSEARVQLAFGHRRLRAFRHLHQAGAANYSDGYFPVHIDTLSDQQMLDAVWAENNQRKDISAVEEAELLKRKLDQVQASDGSQRDVAEAWGLARSTIANKLRLLNLPPEVQQANRDGRLSERVCADLLRVAEIQTAVDGRIWGDIGSNWQRLDAPAAFIANVLAKPENVTSDNVRAYTDKALRYAGDTLPAAVAKHAVQDNVVQELCKGCHFRVNQVCLKPECLETKKKRLREDMVYDVAAEFGLPVSWIGDDFTPAKHEPATRSAIAEAWKNRDKLPPIDFVVGWQLGSGVRPFPPDDGSYFISDYRSDEEFDNNGRAGIVIGVRDGYLPQDVATAVSQTNGTTAQVEDVATMQLRNAWDTAAKKHITAMTKAAKAALIEEWGWQLSDRTIRIAPALIQKPDADEPDGYEAVAKLLVNFLWERGQGVAHEYQPFEMARVIRAALARAGLNPDSTLCSGVRAYDLQRDAELILDFWYDLRTYGSKERKQGAHGEIKRLLAIWPNDDDETLAMLRVELERARRDGEKVLAAKAQRDAILQDPDADLDEVEGAADDLMAEVTAELEEAGVL
ncbi:MAG: ParB/RepB/Spo0J family partition protein [Ardenticatenaceae bacterium]|nr:ParB/RepB/Spo0J family partition protein [Anaerolineales bacterium]MCB8923034.1 ParB/RepB/Spo0J family partition protein [Ardenticatenaceae bacterium]